jgi:hypothetical protein
MKNLELTIRNKELRIAAGNAQFLILNSKFLIRNMICALVACVLMAVSGCEGPGKNKVDVLQQIEQLKGQNAQLQIRLEEAYNESKQLKKQIALLQGLPPERKTEAIYNLRAVKIGNYTNLYDEDANGTSDSAKAAPDKKEKLIVYLEPIDETGDSIKAAGEADVQLWDLNKKGGDALLAQWKVKADELKKSWLHSFFSSSYRISFNVSTVIQKFENELTVRVTFTDYLSGRTFTDQKAIKPL